MRIIDLKNYKTKKELLWFWVKCFVVLAFLTSLSYVTYSFYVKTVEKVLLRADVIVNGESLAPYQYRILAPFAIDFLKNIFGDYSTATKGWIMITIVLFYCLSFYFFLKESGSILLTMIFCLALWGALPSGMWAMAKQEFLEASLILLLYHYQKQTFIRWWPIVIITILSSLNRETYLIALMALGVVLFIRKKRNMTVKRDWIFFASCFSIYAIIYVVLRWYYGIRSYDSSFFMLAENMKNIFRITNLWTIYYVGAGILWIYIFSLIKYHKNADAFILAYVLSFLAVSFFISSWDEHRIFYPMYPLILLQLLHVIKKEFHTEIVN